MSFGSLRAPVLAASESVELLDFDVVPGSDAGLGAAPGSLLLLHGFDEDKQALRPLGARLCPPGAEAVYPSLRGHGDSLKPAWGYSPWEVAADVQRIGDRLPERLNVVGYSYGALIAVLAALVLGPQRVRSLVLLDQSFARSDEDVEFDEWLEPSFLQWHFDYHHVIDAVACLGIDTLVVVAERSEVVGEQERVLLSRPRGGGYDYRTLDADHLGLLDEDLDAVVSLCREFYARCARRAT